MSAVKSPGDGSQTLVNVPSRMLEPGAARSEPIHDRGSIEQGRYVPSRRATTQSTDRDAIDGQRTSERNVPPLNPATRVMNSLARPVQRSS